MLARFEAFRGACREALREAAALVVGHVEGHSGSHSKAFREALREAAALVVGHIVLFEIVCVLNGVGAEGLEPSVRGIIYIKANWPGGLLWGTIPTNMIHSPEALIGKKRLLIINE